MWCSSIKFKKNVLTTTTRGAKNTRTREKKKKKRSQSSSKKSLSRERVRERGRLVARRASKEGRRQERRAARVLFYRRAFLFFARRVVSWGFRKRLKVVEKCLLAKGLTFFFPSLLTDFRRRRHTRKERRTEEFRGQWDGRKSASNALKTNEIDR